MGIKKKIIAEISILVFVCLIFVGFAGIVLYLSDLNSPKLNMLVSIYRVDTEEKLLFRNNYSFSEMSFDFPINQTAINEDMRTSSYVKIVYNVRNQFDKELVYSLDFSDIERENCVVLYSIDNEEQLTLGPENKFELDANKSRTIIVMLKVEHPAENSFFTGYIHFNVFKK